jgi:ribosomal protein S18 acetylase RimI-like enzyme
MSVDVRTCNHADIETLRQSDISPRDLLHHEERWAWQLRKKAVYLLAWRGAKVVGRATLLLRSRYPEVRSVHPELAEINALEARPQGEGIGTALILAAEQEARHRSAPVTGLAVDITNDRAQRLYERLGYAIWAHGLVIDRWMQRANDGKALGEQADECFYLTKQLT